MQPILTASEMRAAEESVITAGTSVNTLMDRAGVAIADAVCRYGAGRPVLILCGPSNNGGDGYVAAQKLLARGIAVRVAAFGDPKTPAAQTAKLGWTGPVEALSDASSAAVLVDALFGTGLTRPLDIAVSVPLQRLAAAAHFVLAVDVPSGVSTDDGADLGAVAAHSTVAMGCLKPAHVLQPSASLCGAIDCADIGIPVQSLTSVLQRPYLAAPSAISHKYSRGLVAVVVGKMRGAALLCASAAQRAGAGYCVLVNDFHVDGGSLALVRRTLDEVTADRRTGCIVVGPGLGRDEAASRVVQDILSGTLPLVLDADVFSLITVDSLQRASASGKPIILTPHDGEFKTLFGWTYASKIDRARDAAIKSGCVIIVKGADTVVASPCGRVSVARTATSWLSSAGTGDVLAGIAGAMLARGLDAYAAACAAVWLHGEAGRHAGPALIADDLLITLPFALEHCA
ncbi:MAG: NAD(P)H-hydrate dehydratase [Chakrabartia sp.]